MNSLKVLFGNIEEFYIVNRKKLLEDDKLRPCKSITRDIFASVNKFKEYYKQKQNKVICKDEIMKNVLELTKISDTVNTNIRVMKEFDFLQEMDSENYKFTTNFDEFINSSKSIEDYFEENLKKVSSLKTMNMIDNSILCVLREGYIHDVIVSFPESKDEFHSSVKSKNDRLEYCHRVKEIYGFCGRRKDVNSDDYTPNANYRVITVLKNMGYIELNNSTTSLKKYRITKKGLLLLKTIDYNLSNDNNSDDKVYKSSNEDIFYHHNRIVFGAPGTGKSHLLEEDRKSFGKNYERVTFHPNYSYSQFVGTYKPVPIEDTITYEYVPGPFMRVLVKSMQEKDKPVLLLIEEINRANVASVFGELFQLLDRNCGQSEYEIETSEDVRKYLNNKLKGNIAEYEKIKIPSNMYIWATMNSADQGVFPMDTAFKRRWDFEYIDINDNELGIKGIKVVLGEDKLAVEWNALRKAINDKLLNICRVNEDKLLGPYFISKAVLETGEEGFVKDNDKFIKTFKSKVLMYIYEDAAGRQNRSKIFKGCIPTATYSMICSEFDNSGVGIFGDDIDLKQFESVEE